MNIKRLVTLLVAALFATSLAACGSPSPDATAAASEGASPPGRPSTAAPADVPTEPSVWLFVGDSLTAGYGLAAEEAYVADLGRRMTAAGLPWTVRNAGVSGDTSAGVLRRIDWLLTPDVHTVFLCIGGNDCLRGLPVADTRANLEATIAKARAKGVRVLLAGMKVPPNYGADHARAFEAVFPAVAREADVPLLPFLLDGVGGVPELNQADGIHPTAEGQRRVAAHVWDWLERESLLGDADGQ